MQTSHYPVKKAFFPATTPPPTFKKPTRSKEVSNSECVYFKLADGLRYDEHFLPFGLRWSRHVAFLCLYLTGCVSGELLGVKCLYNLEPHCQDVNGL